MLPIVKFVSFRGLCHLLFLIFINDMPLHLDTDIDLYADDTINHCAGKTTDVIETKLQVKHMHL